MIQTRLQKHQKDTYASFARIEKFSHLGPTVSVSVGIFSATEEPILLLLLQSGRSIWMHLEFPLSLALQEESGDGVTQAKTVEYGSVSKLCCRMFWAIDRSKMSYVLLPRR